MYFTLGQAAKEVGKSKGTLSNMIKSGKLSVAEKTEKGYKIDASELFRVFPKLNAKTVTNEQSTTHIKPLENSVMQKEIDMLRERLRDKEKENEKLWAQLEKTQSTLDKQTHLLSDMREKTPQKPVEGRKKFLGIF